MGSLAALLTIVARRSMANRRLLTTVVVGIVLASALMSSVVLYSDAIRDLGLRHALDTQPALSMDIQVVSSSAPVRREDSVPLLNQTAQLLKSYAGNVIDHTVTYGRSATFFLTSPGKAVPTDDNKPRSHFQFVQGIADHINVVDGRAPQQAVAPSDPTKPPSLEVSLGKAAADQLGVKVGDTFELHPFWKPTAAPIVVTVAGLVEPKDPNEAYWFGKTDRFIETTTSWPTYPFIVDQSAFTDVLANYLQDMDGTFETYAFVDIANINSRNAQSVENSLGGLDAAFKQNLTRTSMQTSLQTTIHTYRTKLFFTRLPLFALMAQVVGVVLYYLMMVASMLVERQSGEIALLKSRGASPRQIVSIYAIEGGILSAAGAIAGPFAAVGAIGILGYTPPFHDLTGGSILSVPITVPAFGMAMLGALLALVAMLWPAYRAASNSVIDHKRQMARPPQQSVFLRYYLDLILLGAGAFAFYELRQRGSLVTDRLFGNLSADPILLISPTLFMLMVALVFLRLFPLALRLAGWMAKGLNGATIALGLSRMVRSPLHHSRLILLLLLATAVGMFAAGFRATLARSYDDRAGYQAGAAGRLEDIRTPVNVSNAAFASQVQDATGASGVSPVARVSASYSVSRYNLKDVTVLGLNAGDFAQYAFWRSDFASKSLPTLMGELTPPPAQPAQGMTVPANSRFIGLWAQFPLTPSVAQLGVRLVDPDGVFWEYRLTPGGVTTPDGWQFFQADLSKPIQVRFGPGPQVSLAPPKTLDSVYVRISGNPPQIPERDSILLDALQVWDGAALPADWPAAGFPGGTVVEPFSDISRYELITGVSASGDPGAVSRAENAGPSGNSVTRFAFTRQSGTPSILGLRLRSGLGPVPVVVNSGFLSLSSKKVGDEVPIYLNRQYIQAKIVGTFDLFPGYDPKQTASLFLADLQILQATASRVPSLADTVYANEAWLNGTLASSQMTAEALTAKGVSVQNIYDRAAIRAQQSSDPLVAASWEGILFLSFAAVLTLTALGFAVYATLAAQSRALEFAILRTMGYSSRQILALVSFEQGFVIVAGVAVGTLLGFPLGRLMIGYLGVTESGANPLPPIISQVSWSAALTVYGLLALVFIGTIASLATVYSRLAVHRALRIGET